MSRTDGGQESDQRHRKNERPAGMTRNWPEQTEPGVPASLRSGGATLRATFLVIIKLVIRPSARFGRGLSHASSLQ